MKKTIAVLLVSTLALQGCIVAAIGAGVGAWKYGNAKQKTAYANYRIEVEKLNFEREKAGLPAVSMMTYDEWDEGKK